MGALGIHLVPSAVHCPSIWDKPRRLLVFTGIAAYLSLFWWGFSILMERIF